MPKRITIDTVPRTGKNIKRFTVRVPKDTFQRLQAALNTYMRVKPPMRLSDNQIVATAIHQAADVYEGMNDSNL
jgi:hypothetical protein